MGFCGLLCLLIIGRLILGIYRHFLRPGKNLKKYGSWAVVTGATDGIGLALSKELAKQKLNVLLIARDPEKLKKVSKDIEEKFKVETQSLDIDFSNFDESKQARVKEAVTNLEVGVLINNVGMSYPFPNYYNEIDSKLMSSLVNLNVESTIRMTNIFLPLMEQRKRGAIVNISSAASLLPMPLLTGYSATKAFVDYFSTGLHYEYKNRGVHIQVQNPLYVTSKLSKIRRASFTTPDPSGYAKAAIKQIGYEAQVSPYWVHALMLWVGSWLPKPLVAFVIGKMHKGIRSRALKKPQ
jgi:17beta-estradiol 17-dehydrogenase / very-long-chain 3-oxoacyl-CoA reductase